MKLTDAMKAYLRRQAFHAVFSVDADDAKVDEFLDKLVDAELEAEINDVLPDEVLFAPEYEHLEYVHEAIEAVSDMQGYLERVVEGLPT